MNRYVSYLYIIIFGISYCTNIKGKVTDFETNEALIGATVMLVNTNIGASTDIDGFYSIDNIPIGLYQIKFMYIGFEEFTSDSIQINSESSITYDKSLKSQALEVESIQVVSKLDQSGSGDLINNKKKSTTIIDGITSEDISKAGDSNVADAAKRIAGVSIEDGKFAIIRGLSSRYSNTVLNSSPVPSPEADKKIIPLDIIPSSLIQSISAYKTYTPDMPGMFAGGNVDIKTKAYPDKRVFNFKFSSGEKMNQSDADYLLSYDSNMDYFGYNVGARALPQSIPSNEVLSKATVYRPEGLSAKQWVGQLGSYGIELNNNFKKQSGEPYKPISIAIDYGNKFNIAKDIDWGLFSNLSFSNNYHNRSVSRNTYSVSEENYNSDIEMDNLESSYNTNLGFNFSSGINFFNHKISYKYLYSHISSEKVNQAHGYTPNIQPGLFIREEQTEKTLENHNISGSHIMPKFINSQFDWSFSSGRSIMFEPDTRSHNYEMVYDEEDSTSFIGYIIDNQGGKIGYRSFADGVDNNQNLDVNWLSNFNILGITIQSKLGFRNQLKDRTFSKRSLSITKSGTSWHSDFYNPNLMPDLNSIGLLFDDEYYCSYDELNNEFRHGLILEDETANNPYGAYEASENITASFVMFNSLLIDNSLFKLELLAGIRDEKYILDLAPYNSVTGVDATIAIDSSSAAIKSEYSNLLPALNLSLSHQDNKKIQIAYSETLNRPQFRELAPIAYQEFYGSAVAIGFPYLQPATIKNYDLRFEWYLSKLEIFSIGYFSKVFKNPIETALLETPDLLYKTFQNARSANTEGIELELRKNLPFIPYHIGKISLFGNMTISESLVEVDPIVTLFNGTTYANSASETKRGLEGHSKYLYNLSLDGQFINGYSISISYNTFSKRISAVGNGALGDEYEYPFDLLNITGGKEFRNFKISFKMKNLLNSKVRFGLEDDNNKRYYTKTYQPGYSYSIGFSYNIK
tara:strand:+ start:1628 stop:4540 length:2913 start_codon:yes stop_codon:yes gene_type:complete